MLGSKWTDIKEFDEETESVVIFKRWDEKHEEWYFQFRHYVPDEHLVIRSFEEICHKDFIEMLKRSHSGCFFVLVKNKFQKNPLLDNF